MSFVNFKDGPPEHSLDLGCGVREFNPQALGLVFKIQWAYWQQTGTWVLDAAQEWPKCEFVGLRHFLERDQLVSNMYDAKGRL
jgi:hypothetical protein